MQKCAAALSVDVRECRNIRPQDMRLIVDGFQMVIENELTRHEKVIHLNGSKYGYIPSVTISDSSKVLNANGVPPAPTCP